MALHLPYTEAPWLGLFVTHATEHYQLRTSGFGRFLAEAAEAGQAWPPVQAGMFGGSGERLQAAVQAVWRATEQQSRRGPF